MGISINSAAPENGAPLTKTGISTDNHPRENGAHVDQYAHQADKYANLRNDEWQQILEMPSVMTALGDLTGLNCMDLGCGTGMYSRKMHRQGAGNVVGVDLSLHMIRIAREIEETEHCNITYLVENCEQLNRLNFSDDYFDVMFGGWMIPYIPSTERLMKFAENIYRLIKKGGRTLQVFGHENRLRINDRTAHLTDAVFESESLDLQDGDCYKVIFHPHDKDARVELVNHFYRHQTVMDCFEKAGFSLTKFHPLVLETDSVERRNHYQDLLDNPFFVVFEAVKM